MEKNNIVYEFINVKKTPIEKTHLKKITKKIGIEPIYNLKGTTYRKLKINFNEMSDAERFEWIFKEQTMIKRPLFEKNNRFIVGFDEQAILNFVKS